MFERFTDDARRVITLAQEEARGLSHGYIGNEHILLGLISQGEGAAAKALQSLGVTLEAARAQIEVGESAPSGHIPFTGRAKKTLDLSFREAIKLGHSYIGPEHLLLGIIREGTTNDDEGIATLLLQELCGDLGAVRLSVIAILSGQLKDDSEVQQQSRRSSDDIMGDIEVTTLRLKQLLVELQQSTALESRQNT